MKNRSILGLIVLIAAAFAVGLVFAANAQASGEGSPEECETGEGTDITDNDVTTFTAGEGEIIVGVCVKAGQLHTELITEDTTVFECYEIEGIGTDEVTVTRIGDGPVCQETSHLDVLVEQETTTTQADEEPTTTQADEEPTTTQADDGSTTTVAETTTTGADVSEDSTTTSVVEVTTATLPFTGANVGALAVTAIALVALGVAGLRAVRDHE